MKLNNLSMHDPIIIQGGMGAGVSNWRLAQSVSRLGQLGVVSGTALDQILARRLQLGDPGGHMRRALHAFPDQVMAQHICDAYFIPGGKSERTSFKALPMLCKDNPPHLVDLCIVANFVEVYLACEGHSNAVGINFLEKIQTAHLPCIYGAMLAGVSYVIMGAGIPLKIPGVLDRFTTHQPAEYAIHVVGAQPDDDVTAHFDPREYMRSELPPLRRPSFFPVISSNTLATTMLKKANGRVDGFVIETRTAGGHNAPPRGKAELSASGEPVYGDRDAVDLVKIRELGVPFWLAGGYGNAQKLREALHLGASGIQAGTAFEFAEESGLRADCKEALLSKAIAGEARIFTDPLASPTGFPFKVALLEGTCSEPEVCESRPRICDLGFLREPYRTADGSIEYRCASEPKSIYVAKGGDPLNTVGRKCVCNGLTANIGLAQIRNNGYVEQPLITAGDDIVSIVQFLKPGRSAYSVADVIEVLLAELPTGEMPHSMSFIA